MGEDPPLANVILLGAHHVPTPLLRKHLNPFGRSHFDLEQLRQPGDAALSVTGARGEQT